MLRYVLRAAIFTFADVSDAAILARHDLQLLYDQQVPIRALTDISSLLSLVIKSITTTEKGMINNLSTTREACRQQDKAEIGWISRELNIADGLTKLRAVLYTSTTFPAQSNLENEILHWIIRRPPSTLPEPIVDKDSRTFGFPRVSNQSPDFQGNSPGQTWYQGS